ncbi:unnamed protein product [Owenia fusiformis]|uniref:Protein NO VEIN C-terminal domain-containing protein n=1 Tax=Owenia fusiformis TaxID=6347 RepID=A0A8J1TTN2_OWEFU|nr:unnamed protein product [Owenia fusiformis]
MPRGKKKKKGASAEECISKGDDTNQNASKSQLEQIKDLYVAPTTNRDKTITPDQIMKVATENPRTPQMQMTIGHSEKNERPTTPLMNHPLPNVATRIKQASAGADVAVHNQQQSQRKKSQPQVWTNQGGARAKSNPGKGKIEPAGMARVNTGNDFPSLGEAKVVQSEKKATNEVKTRTPTGKKTFKKYDVDVVFNTESTNMSNAAQQHQSTSNVNRSRNQHYGYQQSQGSLLGDPRHHQGSNKQSHSQSQQANIQHISTNKLDAIGMKYIEATAELDKVVSIEGVTEYICASYQVEDISQLGVRRLKDIRCISDLAWKQSKFKLFCVAYELYQSIGTLYDLEQGLINIFNRDFEKEKKPQITSFDDLQLGPLVKQGVIYKLFSYPPDETEFPCIEIKDILQHLKAYMSENDLWRSKVKLMDFMEYLKDEYNVDDPWELGVRIGSLGLGIAVVKAVQSCQKRVMTKAKEDLIAEMEVEAETKINKIRNHFKTSLKDQDTSTLSVSIATRQRYSNMEAIDVVIDLFGIIEELFTESSIKRTFKKFIQSITDTPLARKMFQLALCVGTHEVPSDLVKTDAHATPVEQSTDTHVEIPKPSKEMVIASLRRKLEKSSGNITMETLSHVETSITKEFKFQKFTELGLGTFLQFLHHQKQMVQDMGIPQIIVGDHSSVVMATVSKQQVLEIINQCGFTNSGPEALAQLKNVLCSQYRVKDVSELGVGSLQRLLDQSQNDAHKLSNHAIYYSSSYSHLARENKHEAGNVGLLGHKTKEQALLCLMRCPLMADLATWSQWDLVFQPQFGDLKSFLQRNSIAAGMISQEKAIPNCTNDLYALEDEQGLLYHITQDTSRDQFSKSMEKNSINETIGRLVSIIVREGGTAKASLALLASDVKGHLMTLPTGGNSAFTCQSFVLQCIIKLPLVIAKDITRKVFLEPLASILGKSNCESQLLQSCSSLEETLKLQKLGLLLGINEWTRQFDEKTQVPRLMDDFISLEDVIGDNNPEEDNESDDDDDDISDELDEDVGFSIKTIDESIEENDSNTANEEATPDVTEATEAKDPANDAHETDQENIDKEEDIGKIGTVKELEENGKEERPLTEEELALHVVNEIRQTKFGIGLELNEDGKKITQGLKELLGRSLEKLSKELYNKDTHFVLELIQNADDNSYPEKWTAKSKQQPALIFIIDTDRITLVNNECGFKEGNIRAICDVGRSTKGDKHTKGYIGQKGIGFKSVFKVSDTPEIHSRGYHIKFDATDDCTGYILPHWLTEENRTTLDLQIKGVDLNSERWTTRIVLPLKTQDAATRMSLTSGFHDIHPSLLLFLHRLKSISVINQVTNSKEVMYRSDIGDDVIEIQHGRSTDRWLIVRKTLTVPEKLNLPNIAATEIAMAFPLAQDKTQAHIQLEKQSVFAFLPLRNFGFNFIIQGDFEIPSSRQDVIESSSRNQWLREELPQLFIDSLQNFKAHCGDDVIAMQSFLRFVPLEAEIQGFFQPVATSIIRLLAAKECMLVQGDKQGEAIWKKPSEAVLCHDKLIHEVITPALLEQHLNLHYIHRDISDNSGLNTMLLQSLGVQTLRRDHVVDVFKSVATQWQNGQQEVDVKQLAQWLSCLYRHVDIEDPESHHLLKHISSYPIIPLFSGRCVALDSTAVFFPLEKKGSKKSGKAYKTLEKDLDILDSSLITSLDDVSNSQVKSQLERLGAKHITASDVIEQHIIPALESTSWLAKGEETLVAYVVYVKQQWVENNSCCDMERFSKCVKLLTNKNFCNPATEGVHFSKHYIPDVDLTTDFPGYKWTIVSKSYLDAVKTEIRAVYEAEKRDWCQFLERLGVKRFLNVTTTQVKLTWDELVESKWKSMSELVPRQDEISIKDYECEEFETLVKNSTNDYRPMMKLFATFHQVWGLYDRYKMALILDSDGITLKSFQSTFYQNLRQLPWITACHSTERNEIPQLLPASQVYIRSNKLETLLSHHVPYLVTPLDMAEIEKSQFVKDLDLITIVNMESQLKSWAKVDIKDAKSREFFTSMHHICTVYKHLERHFPEQEFNSFMQKYPVIFVPSVPMPSMSSYTRPECTVLKGEFYMLKDLCWAEDTGLFEKYSPSFSSPDVEEYRRKLVSQFYEYLGYEFKQLFLTRLNMFNTPTILEYSILLENLCESNCVNDKGILDDVFTLYASLARKCQRVNKIHVHERKSGDGLNQQNVNQVMNVLKDKQIFPTVGLKWVSIDEHPLIQDNPDMVQLFQKHHPGKVNFIHPLPEDNEDAQGFLKMFKVKQFSECLQTEVVPESIMVSPVAQSHISRVVPFLQRMMMSQKIFSGVYKNLCDQKIHLRLSLMKFFQAAKLEVVYRVQCGAEELSVPVSENCSVKQDEGPIEFYIHKDHIESHLEICGGLMKILLPKSDPNRDKMVREYTSFCRALKQPLCQQHVSEEEFVKEWDLVEVPESEKKWHVEAPRAPTPPPPTPEPVEEEPAEARHANKKKGVDSLMSWPPPRPNPNVPRALDNSDSQEKSVYELYPKPAPPEGVHGDGRPGGKRVEGGATSPMSSISGAGLYAGPPFDRSASHHSESGHHYSGEQSPSQYSGSQNSGLVGRPAPEEAMSHQGDAPPVSNQTMRLHAEGEHSQHINESRNSKAHDQSEIPREDSSQSANFSNNQGQMSRRTEGPSIVDNPLPAMGPSIVESNIPPRFNPDLPAQPMRSRSPSPVKRYHGEVGPVIMDETLLADHTNISDIEIEEIPTEIRDLDLQGCVDIAGPQSDDFGRWGESWVHEYLQFKHREEIKQGKVQIKWMNIDSVTTTPFDILLKRMDENGIVSHVFIEVKSTIHGNRANFPVSVLELQCAMGVKDGDQYCIYRVYNAGDKTKVQLKIVQNPKELLQSKSISLFMCI